MTASADPIIPAIDARAGHADTALGPGVNWEQAEEASLSRASIFALGVVAF